MTSNAAYLGDSSLRTLETVVTRCEMAAEGRWHVQLGDTVLFPGGGGQPCDLGCLVPLATDGRSGGATTAAATSSSGNERLQVLALHTSSDGAVVHEVGGPLAPGSAVRVELDWARRLDHMQQHSGQHLLSAVLERLFQAPTTSWAMSPLGGSEGEETLVQVTVRQPEGGDVTTRAALQSAEAETNRIVGEGREVSARLVEDASQLPRLRGELPDDSKLQAGIRIVTMEGVDATACGGTHVRRTSDLQLVRLIRAERRAGGLARIYFCVGGRALVALQQQWQELQDLAQLLGRPIGALAPAVQQLQSKTSQAAADLKAAMEEAGSAAAAVLTARAEEGEQVLVQCFALGDPRFLSGLSQAVLARRPDCCTLLVCKATVGGKDGCALLAGPEALVKAAAPAVCERLGVTGKVARGVLQGKLTAFTDEALAQAAAAVQAAVQEQHTAQ